MTDRRTTNTELAALIEAQEAERRAREHHLRAIINLRNDGGIAGQHLARDVGLPNNH